MKIGMYTEDDIFEFMSDVGGFLGRSMYDAIFNEIHTLITENKFLQSQLEQLQQENKNLVCNNIILNEDRRIMSKQLNDIRELFEQYDIKYLRETTEHNLADFIEIGLEKLNIIERNTSDESSD